MHLGENGIVVGEAEVEWQPDGNEILITAKLQGNFEGDRLGGMIMEELVSVSFDYISSEEDEL